MGPVDANASEVHWAAPPLFDPQINGFAGVDFQQDDVGLEALFSSTRSLRAHGCGRFFLTLITDDWPRLTSRLSRLVRIRRNNPELQRIIAGWHIEGPFLSAEAGYRGAHDPSWMIDPTPDRIEELHTLVRPDPLLITLAPERAGAIESIAAAIASGVRVSLGHTNASTSTLLAAVAAGATMFTHLGNACPQLLDRHDNILWRVLDDSNLCISLIPDGHHVSPSLFRLIHRLIPAARIIYTTDAMASAAAPPGRYRIGRIDVEVGDDRIVRQPGQTNFAGSALTPIDGIREVARMLHCPWQDAWDGFSTNSSRHCGLTAGDLEEPNTPCCLLQSAGASEDVTLIP